MTPPGAGDAAPSATPGQQDPDAGLLPEPPVTAGPPVGVLLGPARSGTSLLYRTLCLHPGAGYLSNYVRRAPGLPALAVLDRVPRAAAGLRRKVWFGEDSDAYRYDKRRTLLDRVFPQPTEGEPVFAHCGVPQFAWDPAPSQTQQVERLRRTASAVVRWSGADVLLTKRIAHNRRVPLLRTAFPQAVFVALVRDGRAVALSLSRVDWWDDDVLWWAGDGVTPRRWAAEGGDPWEAAARNWVEDVRSMEAGLADVPQDRVVRLSYEEFVADPVPQLQRVAGAVGLDPDDAAWLRALRTLSFPDHNTGWQRRLSPDVVARIDDVQREELVRYGYAG